MFRRVRALFLVGIALALIGPTSAIPPRPSLRELLRDAEVVETLSPEALNALANPLNERVSELRWRSSLLASERELRAILSLCTGDSAEHRWVRRRTLADLAAYRYWLGQYNKAAVSADAAYRAGQTQAAAWAKQARLRARLVETCRPLLSSGERCIAAEPVGTGRWILLTAVGEDVPANGDSCVEQLGRYQLVLVERTGLTYRLVQRFPLPGEYNSIRLITCDVNQDRTKDVITLGSKLGGSWQPVDVDVFRIWDGRLKRTFHTFSEHGITVTDLDRNGTVEIITARCIGSYMCHAEQPRWLDVYSPRNGIYVRASAQFPAQFQELKSKLKQTERKYPKDEEIIYHRALVAYWMGERKSLPRPISRAAQSSF